MKNIILICLFFIFVQGVTLNPRRAKNVEADCNRKIDQLNKSYQEQEKKNQNNFDQKIQEFSLQLQKCEEEKQQIQKQKQEPDPLVLEQYTSTIKELEEKNSKQEKEIQNIQQIQAEKQEKIKQQYEEKIINLQKINEELENEQEFQGKSSLVMKILGVLLAGGLGGVGIAALIIFIIVKLLLKLFSSCCKKKDQKDLKDQLQDIIKEKNTIEKQLEFIRDMQQQKLRQIENSEEINNNKEYLGKGGFGKVFKTLRNKQEIVFKEMDSSIFNVDELCMYIKELIILSKTPKHLNITKALGYGINYEEDNNEFECRIYFEYANQKDLQQFVLNNSKIYKNLNDNDRIQTQFDLCFGIIDGLECLHIQNIVHLDLKPANVLVHQEQNGKFIAKITDFGISKELNNTASTQIDGLSPRYMPVEYGGVDQENAQISKKTDIWSLGCLLVVIFGQVQPWERVENNFQVNRMVFERKPFFDYLKEETIEKIKPIRGILNKCLQHTYQNRPELQEVREDLKQVLEDYKNRFKKEE